MNKRKNTKVKANIIWNKITSKLYKWNYSYIYVDERFKS